jgi:hypothetical protein
MTRDELKEKIKVLVKQVYKPEEDNQVDWDVVNDVISNTNKFPIIDKFPELKDTIILLLSTEYEPFISDIQWVAPKPVTFRVVLSNGEIFYLTHTDKSWIAQIEGKKYYLLNLSEEELASESLARMLYYANAAAAEAPELEIPAPAEEKPAEEKPAEEEKPEEAPSEET